MCGILQALCNSTTAVRLGKVPVVWITLFCICCNFIRCSKILFGTDINYYRSNECFVHEGKFNDSAYSLTFEKKYTLIFSFIRKDLRIPTVKEEISRFSSHYGARISVHPNELITSLTEPPIHKRLRRYWPHDLLTRF
jgi:hypothetical protein